VAESLTSRYAPSLKEQSRRERMPGGSERSHSSSGGSGKMVARGGLAVVIVRVRFRSSGEEPFHPGLVAEVEGDAQVLEKVVVACVIEAVHVRGRGERASDGGGALRQRPLVFQLEHEVVAGRGMAGKLAPFHQRHTLVDQRLQQRGEHLA
jgi:hypothetical protein